MPPTEPLEVQTEPLTPRREQADRSRRTGSPSSPRIHPAVLDSRARRLSHELVVVQAACDDDGQELAQPATPSRMEQARDDLLRFMERPCWARLVSGARLEPWTRQIPRHALLTRVSLWRGQAVVHLLGIVGSGALFFFLLMNWQACNLQHPCRVACNPVPRSLRPAADRLGPALRRLARLS